MPATTTPSHTMNPAKRILFLGYSREETRLIAALEARGCEVTHCADKLTDFSGYELIVSFGYRHIIRGEAIRKAGAPIINLHISLLPWNRGAHPNYWAFVDGTPHGVSIHLIDEGIDTGPILFQREVSFDAAENTFALTHKRLVAEIEALFIAHLDDMLLRPLEPRAQTGQGSLHKLADLPKDFPGWDTRIDAYLKDLGPQ